VDVKSHSLAVNELNSDADVLRVSDGVSGLPNQIQDAGLYSSLFEYMNYAFNISRFLKE
jgi:hypothetical protein